MRLKNLRCYRVGDIVRPLHPEAVMGLRRIVAIGPDGRLMLEGLELSGCCFKPEFFERVN